MSDRICRPESNSGTERMKGRSASWRRLKPDHVRPEEQGAFSYPPALPFYRLAKLYQQKGIKDKVKAQYERFHELWKLADPGRPEVADAKERLAAL